MSKDLSRLEITKEEADIIESTFEGLKELAKELMDELPQDNNTIIADNLLLRIKHWKQEREKDGRI